MAKAAIKFSVVWSFETSISQERITNGDFASGETGWTFFGDIVHSVVAGKLNVYRNGATGAAFYQDFAYAVANADTFTVAMDIANPSAVNMSITVVLQDPNDFDDYMFETRQIDAGAAEATETFNFTATGPWSPNTRFAVNIETDNAAGLLTFDNISVTATHDKTDITTDVREIHARTGFSSNLLAHMADVGTCTLILNNTSRNYSPDNTSGIHYGKQWINALVSVYQTLVLPNDTTLWRGYVRSVVPEPGAYGGKRCIVECEDVIGLYARSQIAINTETGLSMAQALNLIGAEVFKTARATGTITFTGTGSDGDLITVGVRSYTLRTAVSTTAYEVLIGADETESARNLAAAINDDPDAAGGTQLYGDNTYKSPQVSASVAAGVITLTALNRSTLGNSIGLTENSADVTISGATLTGGANPGSTSLATGKRTFDITGDQWSEERTNALRAFEDVVGSEFGHGWVTRGGTLTAKDKDWEFILPSLKTGTVYDTEMFAMSGEMGDYIYNRVTVNYQPRGTSTVQVIAQANNTLSIPGKITGTRWNREVGYPTSGEADALPGGTKVVRLPFVESATGNIVGATDVITPRRSTDFTVNDSYDLLGYDYTNDLPPQVRVSIVVTGSGVECTFSNLALGALYVANFQVRGLALIGYDAQQVIREDSDSITLYQRQGLTYHIALPSGVNFAEQIALYLVGRYANPRYRVSSLTVRDAQATVVNMAIGDAFSLTEQQTGISHVYYVRSVQMDVTGMESFSTPGAPGPNVSITLGVKRIDEVTYWILDSAAYSVLGYTTRPAL